MYTIWNAKILAADSSCPTAEAVAIEDGKILAIGRKAAIDDLRGQPHKLSAHSTTVFSGFIEAHMHLFLETY
jgi:predicted amidohydrolase YtcJ